MRNASVMSKVLMGVIVCAVAVMGILPAAVWAADINMLATQQVAAAGKVGDETRLEFQLQRLQLVSSGQQSRLDMGQLIATQTQTWIDALKADGKDTSALEVALNTYKGQLQTAQAAHDKVKSLLDAKSGFDANGKVTNAEQARDTLKNVREALKDAHTAIKGAAETFRAAVKSFRQANKPPKIEKPEQPKS